MKANIYKLEEVIKASEQKLFNVVSLFAGCGGSSTGYRLGGGDVLAINEFIPLAYQSYAKNYPNTHIFTNDIRELTGKMILDQIGLKVGELDILDGSPPCASFSMVGIREEGWGTERKYSDTTQRVDDLFFEYARIVKEIQPKVFVAENVKGLTIGSASNVLGSNQMGMFGFEEDTIYTTLVNCGYNVRYKVLNAKNYGVPQQRERLIFIGVRKDIDAQITFPKGTREIVSIKDAFEGLVNPENELKESSMSEGKVKHIAYQLKQGESGDKYVGEKRKYFGLKRPFYDDVCYTILARQGNKAAILHPIETRQLTISEIKRIMSFPDDYYVGDKYIQKCERLGRAVAPLMMKAISEHIYETILKKIKNEHYGLQID
jgi:DNA (cytosine-5)-methyltransferase 1